LHTPDTQAVELALVVEHTLVVQVTPHELTVLTAVSQPFALLPSQSIEPAAHAWHVPLTHVVPAAQTAFVQPQAAFESVCSQPLPTLPSQSVLPAGQLTQVPLEQVVPGVEVQFRWPQPQSVSESVCSQPLAALPSQSAPEPQATHRPVEVLQVWPEVAAQLVCAQPQLAEPLRFSQPFV
jgi:hypothetical protein